ncbi:MAG: hypothetical protein FD163_956 [Hyphomonadaceae bacterium]|nr:MAG: hypothetical protein FD128_1359 [Hyphomonadaceae bacterium]KAF0186288.1 MAG: hypothetical protein FD163_956 [Hyphomonadaceae bacterium]
MVADTSNTQRKKIKIAFVASARPEAQEALEQLRKTYGDCPVEDANLIVALGGDGLMLEVLRAHIEDGVPVFGLNYGTIGFLMNDYSPDNLLERLNEAKANIIHPLKMVAETTDGKSHVEFAINEVSLLRQTHQTARFGIRVDNTERMPEIICDGIILATAAGSTAYNLSAYGPILPIGAELLALTPISVFRPRRWRGAILRDNSTVTIEILEPHHRPVAASADNQEIRDVKKVTINLDRSKSMIILFDKDRSLDERVLAEQFAH